MFITASTIYQLLLAFHFIGLAFGLGGAAVADFTFLKAVRMGDRITPETIAWLRTLSQVMWIGLGILALSGLGLFLISPAKNLSSPGFLAKMVFVAIIIVNGVFLNFYATARLTTFNFTEQYKSRGAAWRARKLSFIFGAISATSWYAAFFTAMFKKFASLTFAEYMLIYVAVLSTAITTALLLEKKVSRPRALISVAPTMPTLSPMVARPDAQSGPIAAAPMSASPSSSLAYTTPQSTQPAPASIFTPTAVATAYVPRTDNQNTLQPPPAVK